MKKEQNVRTTRLSGKYGLLMIGSLATFGLVYWMVSHEWTIFIRLEKNTAHLFQQIVGNPTMNYSSSIVNNILTFLATYGGARYLVIFTCLIAFFLFVKRHYFLAFWFLGSISTGGVIGIYFKKLFHRTRPIEHLSLDNGFSFPSGHAVASTLFFLAILLVFLPRIKKESIRRWLTGLTYVVWIGILFSRLYFQAHFLGDIIAGVSFGTFWTISTLFVCCFSVDWFYKYIDCKIKLNK